MGPFDFPVKVDDKAVRARTVALLRDKGIRLPTFGELADPAKAPKNVRASLASVGPDEAHPHNLYRVNWFNDLGRTGQAATPVHVELPASLTGVKARIVVALGALFPMIRAHKVLAAYACLAPRLVAGRFDPARQRAVWPSTGNYCRGGVAISRILGCRGVAVLPGGMSQERFDWLGHWVTAPEDIVRTPGTESNVKEIYDRCAELARDPANEIVNQFSEFGNYLGHWRCTGPALEKIFQSLRGTSKPLKLAGYVSASGSAGTLAAGDYLKDKHGTRIAVVEAVECPTLLMNGYGEHNIQGIGDKHVPLIHNVMNTDLVIGISDQATDGLNAVFNTEAGRAYLGRRLGLAPATARMLGYFGLSSIANVLGAIKMAKHLALGPDDVIITVATDGHELYRSELETYLKRRHNQGELTDETAAELVGRHLLGADTEHVLDATHRERERVFNLGYFTWVEQQGIALADFDRRKSQDFWRGLHALVPQWDEMIAAFNRDSGMHAAA
ncbi:MAG: pyridoxal-phosphate dependent enzyme [Hyphomicrobiaceae bacterium]|nr:MAG: pyridoxal-phosphate dependent enzyme [Hyphomicrobiaceae bacterium]